VATTITDISQSKVIKNLDTYNHTTLLNAIYMVSISLSELPPSAISIVIQKNGSPVISSAAPAASQSHMELQAQINCVPSDVLSVVLSSSSANDQQFNVLKGILSISAGPQA
jgi:hypothetical protein